jgi:hypothetical protein
VRCVFTFLACSLLTAGARAQDSHYWNLFYGTQATLLSGAVIGSASDLSATYYNPGMLAVNRESGLLLGANVYQFQQFSIKESTSPGVTDSRIAPAPGLVAGRVPVDSALGGIAYSILTRQYLVSNLESRFVGARDLVGNDGVPDRYSADLVFNANLSETWVGVTLFRLLNPQVGVGLSNYVAYRGQATRGFGAGQALETDGMLTSTTRIRDINYYNFRLVWKLGVGVDLDPLTLGLTVTTPSVNLFGKGSAFVSYSGGAAGTLPDTARKSQLVASNQEDVAARYKTSWAIGAGLGYRLGKSRIHFSAEWYAPVALFRVLETSSFIGQSDGKQYAAEITTEMKAVLNAGLGFQYTLSPTLSLFTSIVTDFSNVPPGTSGNLALSPWDLLHYSLGAVLSFSSLDLTAGASFAGGQAPLKDIPWARESSGMGQVLGTLASGDVQYFSATVVLAFTFKL